MADETFRVTDRRGRPDEAGSAEATVRPPEPGPSRPHAESTTAPAPTPVEDPTPGIGPLDLQGLFIMFASSGLMGLGAAPDPASGQPRVDLEQTQEAIETLLLLRDKTAGNRTEAESRLLDDILYDLQMRYVQVAKGQSPAR